MKFTLLFLFNTIIINPAKIIFIALIMISYHYAGSFAPDKIEKTIIDSLTIGKQSTYDKRYLYFYSYIHDNTMKIESLQYDKPQKIVDGKISYLEYNGFNALFWILFGLSSVILLVLLIAGLTDGDDASWEFDRVWSRAFSLMITCELEDGRYHYMAFGRLLDVRDSQLDRNYRYHTFNISGFADLRMCPKFKTKSGKRDNLLTKLGI